VVLPGLLFPPYPTVPPPVEEAARGNESDVPLDALPAAASLFDIATDFKRRIILERLWQHNGRRPMPGADFARAAVRAESGD
jgi:hypothetical protein